MKDFMKKKMYLILLVVSFSTLFSAILYAESSYVECEFDIQCPPGKICVIPGNYCMVPAIISCTETLQYFEVAYCWDTNPQLPSYEWCFWTGKQSDTCMLS
jgi:hypothetical protein